jgi:hypothetical protein
VRFDFARIERELAALVGIPLCGASRAADILTLSFGEKRHGVGTIGARKGKPTTYGEYAVHVQCAWRLAGPDGIVVARRDRYYPHSDLLREREDWQWLEDAEWDSSQPNASRWDERLRPWVEGGPYAVTGVRADELGGFQLALERHFLLEVFPDCSYDAEYWRFFKTDDPRPHFVVEASGINASV